MSEPNNIKDVFKFCKKERCLFFYGSKRIKDHCTEKRTHPSHITACIGYARRILPSEIYDELDVPDGQGE